MILEGDHSVIDAIKTKKRLMDAGEAHGHIRPLLIIDGGLMKGAYGAGAVVAMEVAGLTQVFSEVVGISSGAPTAAYFLAGEAAKGSTIFHEECCSGNFLKLPKLTADTGYIVKVFQGSTNKKLPARSVFESESNLYIAATEYETARPTLLTPTDEDSLHEAIHASILMPTMSTVPLYINGVRYVDGGFAEPSAIRHAVEMIEATHVLLVTNQNQVRNTVSIWEHILIETMLRFRMNHVLRKIAHRRKGVRLQTLSYLQREYAHPVAVIWGDGSIDGLEQDSAKVKSVIEKSKRWWLELLAK